jgi:hypothetical protein
VLLPLRLFELNGTATRPVHSRSPRCCVLRILKPRTLSVAGYARRLFFCGFGFAPVTCWTSIVVSKLHAHTTALPLLPCERAASYHSRSDPNMAHAPAEVHDLAHLVLCCPCAWAGGLDGVWAAHECQATPADGPREELAGTPPYAVGSRHSREHGTHWTRQALNTLAQVLLALLERLTLPLRRRTPPLRNNKDAGMDCGSTSRGYSSTFGTLTSAAKELIKSLTSITCSRSPA